MSMIDMEKNHVAELVRYLFFGGCTTLLNISVYCCLYNILGIVNIVSVITSWLFSVIFAFVTNKLYVFKSVFSDRSIVYKEIVLFFVSRVSTGVIDVVIMYMAVDVMSFNSTICKIVSNVIVVILNFVVSKFCVFKTKCK